MLLHGCKSHRNVQRGGIRACTKAALAMKGTAVKRCKLCKLQQYNKYCVDHRLKVTVFQRPRKKRRRRQTIYSSSLPFKNIHYLFQCDIEDVFNMLTDEIGETIPCSIHAHVLHSFQQNCVRIRIACILLNDRNHASFVVASNEKRPLEVKKFDYSRIYTIFCIAYMAITMHNAKTFQKLNTF
jgi:hypothetical protein